MRVVEIHHPGTTNRDIRLLYQFDKTPSKEDVERDYTRVWAGSLNLKGEDHEALENLWRIVEIGGPACPIPRLASKENAIRSFMVGDVVRLDGALWVCASFGWEKV